MKLQQKRKYSGQGKKTCSRCTFERDGKCPAVGRECRRCGQEGHFSRSSLCKGKVHSSTKRVEDSDMPSDYDEANYSSEEESVKRVEREDSSSTIWPGVSSNCKPSHVRNVSTGGDRWVELTMGKSRMKLYADTGSRYTIITPAQYRKSMGKVVAADTRLSAWGSKTYLDVKGMFLTTLTMDKGASKEALLYVVDGYRPEALLGDRDAEDLGIFTFHKEGREEVQVKLLVSDLRKEVNCEIFISVHGHVLPLLVILLLLPAIDHFFSGLWSGYRLFSRNWFGNAPDLHSKVWMWLKMYAFNNTVVNVL